MNNGSRTIAVVALVIAVVGLAIGFAAFSSTLTISSSATVTPSSTDFSVVFKPVGAGNSCTTPGEGTSVVGTATGTGAQAGTATIDGTTLSNVQATFTEPGQSVTYNVCAQNAGKYLAYLNAVSLGSATCTAASNANGTATTEALINGENGACKSISISAAVNGTSYAASNSSISSHTLAVNTAELVTITITYAANGNRADGNFNVAFGNTTLKYESID